MIRLCTNKKCLTDWYIVPKALKDNVCTVSCPQYHYYLVHRRVTSCVVTVMTEITNQGALGQQ